MIAKNKRRSETMQGLTVILSKLARLGIDPLRDQYLSRNLARLSCPRCEELRRLSELIERLATAEINDVSRSIVPVRVRLHDLQYTVV